MDIKCFVLLNKIINLKLGSQGYFYYACSIGQKNKIFLQLGSIFIDIQSFCVDEKQGNPFKQKSVIACAHM